MKTDEMIKALFGLAKKGLFVNYQERELIRSAAIRISQLNAEVTYLKAKIDAANHAAKAMEVSGDA